MKEPREVRVSRWHGSFRQTNGRFTPNKASVGARSRKGRTEDGNTTFTIEILMSHENATIGTARDTGPEIREHEERHQEITQNSFEAVAPDVKPFENVSFSSRDDMIEALKSKEAKEVLTSAAQLGTAISNYNNAKFDLEDPLNDQDRANQKAVDEAQSKVEKAGEKLNNSIGTFVKKFGNSDSNNNSSQKNDENKNN